jgi:hypothetical protein
VANRSASGGYAMNKPSHFKEIASLVFVLLLAGILLAQGTPDKMLVVNGKTSATALRVIDGRSYMDIESFAQITNGVVTFEANRVILTIPLAPSNATPLNVTPGLSSNFAKAAIASVAEMKEWQGALRAMVTYGLATGGDWARSYQDQVMTSLEQATAAASTDSDRAALQLLENQFANLAGWTNTLVAERQALDGAKTVDPNSLRNDPVLAKISACGSFLGEMLVSGAVADDPHCY